MNDTVLAEQVKTIQRKLRESGWRVANALGELVTKDGILWFTATYTHGEYTVETSYRPRGAGPAEGAKRVRLTPELVAAHPGIADELADELIQTGWAVEVENQTPGRNVREYLEGQGWPAGPTWKEFAVL